MLEKIQHAIEKSHSHLAEIIDKLEEGYDDLSEESGELWDKAKPKLQAMKNSLSSAAQSFHAQTDEALLQGHLAAMDAHDQWTYLQGTVHELTQHAVKKGQTGLQHSQLQAHLAEMDARDFIKKQEKEIRQNFQQARGKLEQTSHQAAIEIEKSLENIGSAYANTL